MATKRCFEQKDLLANLLAAPTRTNHGASDESENGYVHRLAETLGDGRAAQVPAHELKLLFQSLAKEFQLNRWDRSIESVAACDDAVRSPSLDLSPRKRRRRLPENNLHSMLRFVERAEEEVICVTFEMAMNANMMSSEHFAIEKDNVKIQKKMRQPQSKALALAPFPMVS
ncbi:hypothetical protein ACHAWF_018214 [Thalassiosira exigua]